MIDSQTAIDFDEERLLRLFDDLNASGFKVTPDLRIRVTSFVLGLCLAGLMPRSRRRFGNMLGAILCSSAEEQKNFQHIFRFWFPEKPADGADPEAITTEDHTALRQLAEERHAAEVELQRRLRKAQMRLMKRRLKIYGIAFLVMFAVAVVIQFTPLSLIQPSNPEIYVTQQTKKPVGEDSVGSWVKHLRFWDRTSDRVSKETQIIEAKSWVGSLILSVHHAIGLATTLLLLIPLAVIALVVASSKKLLSAYAKQTQVLARKEFRHLFSQGVRDSEFLSDRFFHGVQPMRWRQELPSQDIDIERTIDATVRAGGHFSLVYAKRLASPEYVALIDRRVNDDHFARYSRAVVSALEQAGVNLTAYYFDQDPRRLSLGPGQRVLDLDDLATMQSSRRQILFSDGQGLLDMATGLPHYWASFFSEWTRAVIITPKDPRIGVMLSGRLNPNWV